MSAGYTPGPWSACKGGNCSCGFVWSGCGEIHVASAHGPPDLGETYYGSDVATSDWPANARLIATAPDMLAALNLWVEYDNLDEADFSEAGPMLLYANAIEATREAITKAITP